MKLQVLQSSTSMKNKVCENHSGVKFLLASSEFQKLTHRLKNRLFQGRKGGSMAPLLQRTCVPFPAPMSDSLQPSVTSRLGILMPSYGLCEYLRTYGAQTHTQTRTHNIHIHHCPPKASKDHTSQPCRGPLPPLRLLPSRNWGSAFWVQATIPLAPCQRVLLRSSILGKYTCPYLFYLKYFSCLCSLFTLNFIFLTLLLKYLNQVSCHFGWPFFFLSTLHKLESLEEGNSTSKMTSSNQPICKLLE